MGITNKQQSIRVVLVEDHQTIRRGLATLIDGTEGYECVESYADCKSLLSDVGQRRPDVALMDIELGKHSGIDCVRSLKQIMPDVNIVMLSVHEDDNLIFDALCAGACGYLSKRTPPARILDAIREAHEGGSPMNTHIARKVVSLFQKRDLYTMNSQSPDLTLQEKKILSKLADGENYAEIADALSISISTVRYHIGNIYKKLHAVSQTEAVAKAIRKGLI